MLTPLPASTTLAFSAAAVTFDASRQTFYPRAGDRIAEAPKSRNGDVELSFWNDGDNSDSGLSLSKLEFRISSDDCAVTRDVPFVSENIISDLENTRMGIEVRF